jgi:hypothetical protein
MIYEKLNSPLIVLAHRFFVSLMALYIYRSMNSFSQKPCGSKLV